MQSFSPFSAAFQLCPWRWSRLLVLFEEPTSGDCPCGLGEEEGLRCSRAALAEREAFGRWRECERASAILFLNVTLNSCGVSQLSSGSTEGTTADVGGSMLEHATDVSAVTARRPKRKKRDGFIFFSFSSSERVNSLSRNEVDFFFQLTKFSFCGATPPSPPPRRSSLPPPLCTQAQG